MWVYLAAPFLCLKALLVMLFIRDFSKSCEMEMYRVEKANVWMEVALRTPKWPEDDSKLVEFLSIDIFLTPVWLVFMPQYFSSPVFMTISILINKVDNCFVVHLLEPAMKPCFTGDLCRLGVQYRKGNLLSSSDSSIRTLCPQWIRSYICGLCSQPPSQPICEKEHILK